MLAVSRDSTRLACLAATAAAAAPLNSERSPVDRAAIADLDHQDTKRAVLNIACDPTVTDAIAPVGVEHGAGQRLACAARAILGGDTLSMKSTMRRATWLSSLRSSFLAVAV